MKKIERPNWELLDEQPVSGDTPICEKLNKWFDENIEPLNKMLEDAIEVYSDKRVEPKGYWSKSFTEEVDTHSAWVINIQPIKETAEDVLKDFVDEFIYRSGYRNSSLSKLLGRAKKVLDERN